MTAAPGAAGAPAPGAAGAPGPGAAGAPGPGAAGAPAPGAAPAAGQGAGQGAGGALAGSMGASGQSGAGAGSGTALPAWVSGLPEDLKGNAALARHADLASLAREHVNLQGLIGRDKIVVPKEGDAPEVVARFRQALGVPDAPTGYKIERPEALPEAAWSQDFAASWAKAAHGAHLTAAQEKAARDFLFAEVAGAHQRQAETTKASQQAVQAALAKEFGPKAELALAALDRAGDALGLPHEMLLAVAAAGPEMAVKVATALAKFGLAMGEGQAPGMDGGARGGRSAADIAAELARLRSSAAFYDERHAEHKLVADRLVALERERLALTGDAGIAGSRRL